MSPTDIILLSHNRLDYLAATVDALFERTPEPFRLTIVDNASRPDVRNWLAANRDRIHRVIALPENEHVPAFQYGIDATTSDPYVVSDPDVEVPQLQPSWLARLHGLLERHPDYGLVGVAFAGQELPDAEIVDANVGTWFQMIRRDALREPYVKDSRTCAAVREAGYLVGWTPTVVARNLGGGDCTATASSYTAATAGAVQLSSRTDASGISARRIWATTGAATASSTRLGARSIASSSRW